MLSGCALALLALLLPVGRIERGQDVPLVRLDERDIMFARARLEPGSPDYDAYYAQRPENRRGDDRTRSLPGLLSNDASEAHPLAFSSAMASFDLTEALRDAVDGQEDSGRLDLEPDAISPFLKELALYYGAQDAGITEVKPYHIYSHVGRGTGRYGEPISLDHRYAIAFTVEMELDMVGTAPHATTVMESARQYVEAARVAVQLAAFIRRIGFPARAHIDGNYRVIAPLVARDAGLGEIGRMGLLMTPRFGPRVRLGIVTTDLPLLPDGRADDPSVLDFCTVCIKCAVCCPVRAIPMDDRIEMEGALRWRIDDQVCFRYWNATGTDCARCMSVCPYSHSDNLIHNPVRWLVRRSGAARRAAVWLDDLFYGGIPAEKAPPPWFPTWDAPAPKA
jgi:ferredoxin